MDEISIPKKNRELYIRDKGICHICKKWVSPQEATRDHIIPYSQLRKLSQEERNQIGMNGQNIALAHWQCNHDRKDIAYWNGEFKAPPLPSNTKNRPVKYNDHIHPGVNSQINRTKYKALSNSAKCLQRGKFIVCKCSCNCRVHIYMLKEVCDLCAEIHAKETV